MNFTVNEHQIGGVAVLCPQGKLTGCGGRGSLREAIERPLVNGYHKILLNLANVSEVDVSCMEVLSDIQFELNKKGIQIKIVNVSKQVSERMTVAERCVIDDDDYGSGSEALDTLCTGCVFDCPYNSRSETNRESVLVTWGTADASAAFGGGLMLSGSRKKNQHSG